MKIVYEYTNVSGSERLESIVEEKIKSLGNKYPFVIRADVFFKKENNPEDSNKECGIRLSAPGPRLYANSVEESFELAISKSIKDLSRQLEKRKETYSKA